MNVEKILPVCHPAPLKCYLPFSILSSIATANLCNHNWIHTNFIQLYRHYGTGKIESYPMQDFMYYDQKYFRVNEMNNYNHKFRRELFVEDIIFWLDSDNYVVVYADENKIPGTRYYQQRSLLHSQFIFGYNQEKRTFKLMNFSKKKDDLDIIDIPYDSIVRAFFDESTIELYQAESLPWIAKGKQYRVELIRFIGEKSQYYDDGVDLQYVAFEIENYLFSKNSSVFTHNFSGQLKGVWGMDLYKEMQEIIEKESDMLDIRVFQLIYEHKFYMLERLKLFGREMESVSQKYEKTVSMALSLKGLCIKYKITLSEIVLIRMTGILNDIRAIEIECLSEFVELYKNSKLNAL